MFFHKNELDKTEAFTRDCWIRIPPRRDIKKDDPDYDEDNLGSDFEALKFFLIKIYKFLTNKKIVLPEYQGRLHDKANAHTNIYQSEAEEEGTQKLLLGDKGLEPMDAKGNIDEEKDDLDSEEREREREKNESLKEKITMTNTQKSRKIARA